MAIDITAETIIPVREVPSWCEQHLGRRVHPTTVNRWRLRGARKIRLETLLCGGTRVTSAEALTRFFQAVTAAADGQADATLSRCQSTEDAISKAEKFLDGQT